MTFYRKSKEDKTVYKDPKYTQPIRSEKELRSLGGVPDWGPDASKTNIQTGGIDKTLVGTLPPEKSLPMGQLDGLTLLKLAMRDMSDKARKKGIMGGFEKVKGKFGEEGIDIEKGSGSLSGGIINFMNDYISKPIEREFEVMSTVLESIDQKRRDNIDTARQNLNTIYNQATAGGLNWDKLDDKTKNEISALERISGMPSGFFEALRDKNKTSEIIGTKDFTNEAGEKYISVITRDPITGKVEIDNVYIGDEEVGAGNTQVITLPSGEMALIDKGTGEIIRKFGDEEYGVEKGMYSEDAEFNYNEKIDINKLPKLGGKQITNKTARGANLPYGITDKQADWIIDHRIGNIQFQKLKSDEVKGLNDIIELREDIKRIRELKEKVNTGPVAAKVGRGYRYVGWENSDFNQLEIKSGKQLADFIKQISGAAVSEDEARRLAKLVPNIEMQDGQFIDALDDYEDELNGIVKARIMQYDLENEDELIRAIRGDETLEDYIKQNPDMIDKIEEALNSMPDITDEELLEYLRGFNSVGGDTDKATLNLLFEKKEGNKGGQCGRFVNKIRGLGVGDSYSSKMAKMDKSIKMPQPGMVFTMPYKNTGHCGFIMSIKNGIATVKDSNWSLDEKIKTHKIPVNKMTGFA